MKNTYYFAGNKQIHIGWYCEKCGKGRFKKGIGLISEKVYIGLKEV